MNGKWGLVDHNCNRIIEPRFDYASYFSEGLAAVRKDGKEGFVDTKGETVIPFNYWQAFSFREGKAQVCFTSDSCGFIDTSGKTVIPFHYQVNFGGDFHSGLAEVRLHDRYGFIDVNGNVVIPIQYFSPFDLNHFDSYIGQLHEPAIDTTTGKVIKGQKFYFNRKGKKYIR